MGLFRYRFLSDSASALQNKIGNDTRCPNQTAMPGLSAHHSAGRRAGIISKKIRRAHGPPDEFWL